VYTPSALDGDKEPLCGDLFDDFVDIYVDLGSRLAPAPKGIPYSHRIFMALFLPIRGPQQEYFSEAVRDFALCAHTGMRKAE
jgi:hypothetical protein